ncbi:uncharacterized protein LOC122065374 [Macadamia integrifolia]|uniref:uncharacterized protein LOC122065374 n=1 Tax=Macadamia integrifolia TaxID=60698 RepID=UPI001C4EF339|nr:uncharacterized protein LOC122065374 [Macadamia integrifolia]
MTFMPLREPLHTLRICPPQVIFKSTWDDRPRSCCGSETPDFTEKITLPKFEHLPLPEDTIVSQQTIIVEVFDIGSMTIQVPDAWKVQDICEHIKHEHKEKIHGKRKVYILKQNGIVLENSKKLSDYSIENWGTLKFEKQ